MTSEVVDDLINRQFRFFTLFWLNSFIEVRKSNKSAGSSNSCWTMDEERTFLFDLKMLSCNVEQVCKLIKSISFWDPVIRPWSVVVLNYFLGNSGVFEEKLKGSFDKWRIFSLFFYGFYNEIIKLYVLIEIRPILGAFRDLISFGVSFKKITEHDNVWNVFGLNNSPKIINWIFKRALSCYKICLSWFCITYRTCVEVKWGISFDWDRVIFIRQYIKISIMIILSQISRFCE